MSTEAILNNLRAQFRKYAIDPDRLFLLSSNKALELVEVAAAAGVSIAGVEGFLITTAGACEPRQDFSNDVATWRGSSQDFLSSTKDLLKHGASLGVRFQVVFENE